jgi:DNA-directed RNA polymerase specialized sigma subunit
VKSTTLRSVSIFGEDGQTVFDPGVEIDPGVQMDLQDARDKIKILTTRLPGMYRRITESILDGKGFTEISKEMGISKQRVNDIYKSSIVRMKRIAMSMNMESPCE